MKFRTVLMFLASIIGAGAAGFYWYISESGSLSNMFSVILYGVIVGLFVGDLLSQPLANKTT